MNEISEKFQALIQNAAKSFEEIIQEISEDSASVCPEFDIHDEEMLSMIIGFTGEISGRILINTPLSAANNLAKLMNFGDELEDKDELFVYLAEFANMCCGRCATLINDEFGRRATWITPPAILQASNLEVITPHILNEKKYYKTSAGAFYLDIGYNDGSEQDEF